MQTLTLKGVKSAARKAYAAGKLMAQYPRKKDRVCIYAKGEYGCAIGVALNKTTHKAIVAYDKANESGINTRKLGSLIEKELVSLSAEENDAIHGIQSLHDDWANYSRMLGAKSDRAKVARDKFLEAIAA